jgi:ABC-type bacteriocin/lantibiotic exporter with double-glycine peptidase domain
MSKNANTISMLQRFPALQGLQAKKSKGQITAIRQLSATDCGSACLAMVLALHGRHVPLSEVREVAGSSRDGVDAFTLLKAARWYGLQGRGVKLDMDAARFIEKGTILHWNFSHFVVFDRLRSGAVEIVDPACGRRVVPMEEFSASFTGVALVLKPGAGFERIANRNHPVWAYMKSLVRQSGLIWRVLAISLLLQLFLLAAPALTGLLVNSIVPHGDAALLRIAGIGLLVVSLFQYLSSFIRSHLLLYLRTHLDTEMTMGFVDHLASLPYSFFQQRAEGDVIMRVNSNATIREMLTSNTISGLLDGTLAVLYLAILGVASPIMAALVMVLGAVQAAVFLLSYRRYQELTAQELQAQAKTQSHLVQVLSGIETLKAGGAEDRAVQQYSNLFVDELNVSLTRGRLNAGVDSFMSVLRMASPLLVLWVGGFQVLNGNLALGSMLALSAIATGFLAPVSTLIGSALQLQLLRSYIERIDDVLKTPVEQDKTQVQQAPSLRGAVELEKVSFRYGPLTAPAVEDVSLRVEAGQMVAIVGKSGSGKTTLAKLLLGLYNPSAGRVLYDSVDIAGLDLQSVRRQLGVVTQRSYLFGTSIRGNITLNDAAVPLPEVTRAAELACIHEDITALPMEYETPVIEGGGSLSGGQRQRVSIARALLRKPAILLLDEATSELDTITEQRVHGNLAALNCTRVVIAHRLSTVRDADLILVMDKGRIVERGSHDELLAAGGRYAELFTAQFADSPDAVAGPIAS